MLGGFCKGSCLFAIDDIPTKTQIDSASSRIMRGLALFASRRNGEFLPQIRFFIQGTRSKIYMVIMLAKHAEGFFDVRKSALTRREQACIMNIKSMTTG